MDDITLIISFECSHCLNVFRDEIEMGRPPESVCIMNGWVQLIQTCKRCGHDCMTAPFILKVKEHGEIVSYPERK